MKIDIANVSDIDALTELLKILFEQEAEFIPDSAKQKSALKEIISAPDRGLIFKAFEHDDIIGMVSYQFLSSTALGGKVALLEDMIIHPDFRKKGIGKKLINHSISYLRKMDIKRITLLTDSDNIPAHDFYKSLNFQQSNMMPFRLLL